MVKPTDEQQIAVQSFLTLRPLKIAAFAGAGKTTTLKLLAEARVARGVYLAFNKSIAAEAAQKFPRRVDCRTTHSIAYRALMPRFRSNTKLTETVYPKQLAQEMRYQDRVFPDSIRLNPDHQAHLVLGTVNRFCQSGDPEITHRHVPKYGRLLGAKEEVIAEIRSWALQQANVTWAKMLNTTDQMPLGHDGYLKAWSLSRPKIAADYILLDESQDTNAVVLDVLSYQDAQVVYVGDKHQQIYEWRGAINAMERIPGCAEAWLTQSFRFGEQIASTASRVLATLGEERPIRGNPDVASEIGFHGNTKAVLARTNATVILEILEASRMGQRPCVCGGTREIKRLLRDVYQLKKGNPGVSPEFFGFQIWHEVVEFSQSEEGQSIRTFVQLVEKHGEDILWPAVNKAVDSEDDADVILSTAHKAKGREWDSVRLAADFVSARHGPEPETESEARLLAQSEVRLFYVAMTRAKKLLIVDPEMLRIFTTEAWKKDQPESASRAAPNSMVISPPSFPKPPTIPPPVPGPVVNVKEITDEGVSVRTPGIEKDNISRAAKTGPNLPTEPAVTAAPKQAKFWHRLARLLGLK